MNWDPIAANHLSLLAGVVENAGVIDYLKPVVRQLWRANVDRFDEEALNDDSSTLGYTASKNLTNRVYSDLRSPNGLLTGRASATREMQSTVINVADVSIRLVKVPVARGRKPRFLSDFAWEAREGRAAPAARNAARYAVPTVHEGLDPMFGIEVPDAASRVAACRDLFLVWGGDRDGRTAGWIGLPTSGSSSWLAVQACWYDEDLAGGSAKQLPGGPLDGPVFSQIEPPTPQLRLRDRRQEGQASG